MTASYQLPLRHSFSVNIRSKTIIPCEIAVIIPTYNDWDGLRITLDSIAQLDPKPGVVIVANDNDSPDIPAWVHDYDVIIKGYEGNRGPAFARNFGFGFELYNPPEKDLFNRDEKYYDERLVEWLDNRLEFKSEFQWFYFTDCGCHLAPDVLSKFSQRRITEGDSVVAIAGCVKGMENGRINHYMTEQGILIPPMEEYLYGKKIPQSVITANVMVYGLAFAYIGGFSLDYREAAGEDLDFGIRLRRIGMIAYEPDALVRHDFAEDLEDLKSRFRRYGRGNRKLELKLRLPSLRPMEFSPELPEHADLAKIHFESMLDGYESVEDDVDHQFLREPDYYHGLDATKFRLQVSGNQVVKPNGFFDAYPEVYKEYKEREFKNDREKE